MQNEGKRSFAAGAATLAAAGVVVKVIGACYRIPMTNIIGDQGIALYQYAYPIYGTLLALSTAGIPAAVSKLVSEHISRGETAQAQRVFRVSLALLALVGLVSAAVLFCFAPQVAAWVGDPLACLPIRAIAPALFFVAVLSAYRGYYQGQQRMTPTAATQIVEQAGKLVMGLWLACMMRDRGVEYAAAGAILGVTLAEAVAMVLVLGMGAASRRQGAARGNKEPARAVIGRLLPVALPMMLGAVMMPLMGMIDSFVVNHRLLDTGMAAEEARSLYGLLTGPVNTLVNMPSVIPLALAMALVPAIAQACARGAQGEVRNKTRLALKITLTISLPAAVALAVMAEPLMALLYGGLTPEKQLQAARLLQISAPSVVALAIVQTLSGTLQGMGKVKAPVAALAAGAAAKIVVTHILTGIPALNITGACIGTVVCYSIAAAIDLYWASRALGHALDGMCLLTRPAAASCAMGAALAAYLHHAQELMRPWAMALCGVGLGIIVYFAVLWAVGGISMGEARRMLGRWEAAG